MRLGIIGTGGRGSSLTRSFARLPEAHIVGVCDVDSVRMAAAAKEVEELKGMVPRSVPDFRRILDDPEVDAVVIAAPNHWHTPAAILAMQAGKHVYVEKPGSHNAREAELIVETSQHYGRLVQMGNQRRSWPKIIEAMDRVRGGEIGTVHYSRGWYANQRDSIGRGQTVAAPATLDYELWQGPAPRTPYRDNILHYNWHWFWNWGAGEVGNNGIHALDLCRWGLGVEFPSRVSSAGGRYFWKDDQETPDTQVITLDFPGEKSVMWEGLSCNRRGVDGSGFGASFHGEDGSLVIEGTGYSVYDRKGARVQQVTAEEEGAAVDVTGPGFDIDRAHLTNFLNAVRAGEPLRSPIEEGQKSTTLCHLGNIAQRVGRGLEIDPANGRILDDAEAMRFWGRIYEPGWEPRV